MDNNFIKNKLIKLSDSKYKLFMSKLLPDINNIIGVRLPILKKIAKEIAENNWELYLSNAKDNYFEETMLQGLVIGFVNTNIENIIPYCINFIKKINNWSICDSFCFCLKFAEHYPDIVFNFIYPYFYSKNQFEVRFATVMLLRWFNKKELIAKNLKILDSITNQKYYAQMAIAWAISAFYFTNPDATLNYLKHNNLEQFTYNKALQKIKESLKISSKQKEELKMQLSL